MGAAEVVQGLAQTVENIEEGKTCDLCDFCHDFLTPGEFYQCVNGENICPKSAKIQIRLLFEILSRLES